MMDSRHDEPDGEQASVVNLLSVLTALARETDFSRFFEGAAGAAAELLEADGAALIVHEDEDVLRYRFFLGLPGDQLQRQYANYGFKASQGTAGECFRSRRSIYSADYPASTHAMPEYVAAGLRSNLVIPVIAGEQALGVLAVSWFSRQGPPRLAPAALKIAELLASMIGGAYHRQELEHELLRRAHHDALTGLCNRAFLFDRMTHALQQAERNHRLVAVLIMDIDGFKRINDRMGHDAGDKLLREVANRIRDVARESDTIARLGGDEFVVLLENVASLNDVTHVIRRIQTALNIQLTVNGISERIGASIGVTVYPFDESDPETLLAHADHAMYQAKARGGAGYGYFDKTLERRQRHARQMEAEIRHGLEGGAFRLHYQPVIDLRRGAVLGVEALVRWRHPVQGLLSPDEFLSVAGQSSLIASLDDWAMRQAIADAAHWHEEGIDLCLSVNVSARQFERRGFCERLRDTLERQPAFDATRLQLEIAENTATDDLQRATRTIEDCSRLGVRFVLDGFGTGYASAAYLRQLPVAGIKIDRSLVAAMTESPREYALVKALVDMADIFRLACVAVGVENAAQTDALTQAGCHRAQGYALAAPMPADALPAWLEGRTLNACPE